MPRISRVKWPAMNLDYGMMFDIRTHTELMDYWERCRTGQIVDGLRDFLKTQAGVGHIHTGNGSLLEMACVAEAAKPNPRSVVQVHCDVQDTVLSKMAMTLRSEGQIFVNRSGGYFFPTKAMVVSETQSIDAYVLPGARITVTSWPGGTHFYARVGGEDVEMFGRKKWDSESEARRMAERWAKEHNIFVEEQ